MYILGEVRDFLKLNREANGPNSIPQEETDLSLWRWHGDLVPCEVPSASVFHIETILSIPGIQV